MTVVAVVVVDQEGSVLLSRYMDGGMDPSGLATFERKLLRNLIFAEADFTQRQFCEVHGFYVAFQQFEQLTVVLVGHGDTDELLLSPLLDTVLELLRDQLGSRLTAKTLLNSENYGKLMLALDELAPQGILETTDVEVISKMAKMKA